LWKSTKEAAGTEVDPARLVIYYYRTDGILAAVEDPIGKIARASQRA
jgi:hypothetical protein